MSLRPFRPTFLPTFRSTLAGAVLTVALSLLGSSPVQAAEAPEPVREGSFWEATWEWIESWIASGDLAFSVQPVPDAEAERSALDAGWTIDPDG